MGDLGKTHEAHRLWKMAPRRATTEPYLPFPAAERAIQRVWADGRLALPAHAVSGAVIEVIHPGKWNRLGGPDFLGAELSINGTRRIGDVEVHLRARDWQQHGHSRDPAFRNVILHAVLFPPALPILTSDGSAPESLLLLPLLPEDLESAAETDALLALRGHAPGIEQTVRTGNPDLTRDLRRRARERLAEKVAWLTPRLAREGWLETCHAAALEALGQGGNRAPMAALAQMHSAEAFALADPATLYLEQSGRWRLRGLRPAGHPQRRLENYAALCRRRPDWRERFATWVSDVTAGHSNRRGLIDGVLGGALPEGLADMLATDALLPLAAASTDLTETWLEWPAGLRPDEIDEVLRRLGLSGRARNWQVQGVLHTLGRGGKG